MEPQAQVTFTASWDKIDSMSDQVIDMFGGEPAGNTIMAMALTLGRLMTTKPLEQAEEASFVTDILDYSGAYLGTPKES
jgi:hypothetical protein